MEITFKYLNEDYIPTTAKNTVFLKRDSWDDFGFKTLFRLIVFDEKGNKQSIGDVKIAYRGQEPSETINNINKKTGFSEDIYSLGQDAEYYTNIMKYLSINIRENILKSLGDVVYNTNILEEVKQEHAFSVSLLRFVNLNTLKIQFSRILRGQAKLTNYNFFFERFADSIHSGIKLNFKVNPNGKPSTNIHILIGRNGVGKTTLLNNMVDTIISNRVSLANAKFLERIDSTNMNRSLDINYFSGVVSVSFSAFDPFTPPEYKSYTDIGAKYSYIGLKKYVVETGTWVTKDINDLSKDFSQSLEICLSLTSKTKNWETAIKKLESDPNFAEMNLCQLCELYNKLYNNQHKNNNIFLEHSEKIFKRMSSGHAIVLLTITRLIETVEEKTLVLLDEPESHLHPPLLSAFTRALSNLMDNRNGVAIIATHSPVILQEVPKSCVSIIRRTKLVSSVDRPEIETFAENVGILTREVFGLEVSKSGFHDLLVSSVNKGKSYEEIEKEYQNQLGLEGRIMLRSLISARESKVRD